MRILLAFILLLTGATSFSQLTVQNTILATSGNSFSNGTTVIDFTLGETFTATIPYGTSYVVTQGFQQPIRKKIGIIQPVTSIDELSNEGYGVYPNPFRGELVIEIPENEVVDLVLYDNAGRLVYRSTLSSVQTAIDLTELAPANYQLVLTNNEEVIGRIPVIKSH